MVEAIHSLTVDLFRAFEKFVSAIPAICDASRCVLASPANKAAIALLTLALGGFGLIGAEFAIRSCCSLLVLSSGCLQIEI